jgi:uncharacterized protein (DUF1778 family)
MTDKERLRHDERRGAREALRTLGSEFHSSAVDHPSVYCHSEYMATTKDERLQIRVDPRRKQLLERAAGATHQSVSAFVLHAAAQHAEEVLAERTVIQLSPQAARAFSDALAQPATVNERLAAALDHPRGFRWGD